MSQGKESVPKKPRGQRGTSPSRRAAILATAKPPRGRRTERVSALEEEVEAVAEGPKKSRRSGAPRVSRKRQVAVPEPAQPEPTAGEITESSEVVDGGDGTRETHAVEVVESAPPLEGDAVEPDAGVEPRRKKVKRTRKKARRKKVDDEPAGNGDAGEAQLSDTGDPGEVSDGPANDADEPSEEVVQAMELAEATDEPTDAEGLDDDGVAVGVDIAEDRRKLLAVLFGSPEELTVHRMAEILGWSRKEVEQVLPEVATWVEELQLPFEVRNIAGGWRLATRVAYAALLGKLRVVRRRDRLSGAALETLSIVAYKQPIVASEVDRIRGVKCGPILKTLQERGFVHVVGRAESAGRPLLYGTTKLFLDRFGLPSLEDLPTMEDLRSRSDD